MHQIKVDKVQLSSSSYDANQTYHVQQLRSKWASSCLALLLPWHPCRCACVMSRPHMCVYECKDRLLIDFIPTSKNPTIKHSIHRHHAQTCDIPLHHKQASNVYAWEILLYTVYSVPRIEPWYCSSCMLLRNGFSLGIGFSDCIVCIHFPSNSIRVSSLHLGCLRISHHRCTQQWLSHFATAPTLI